jgi:RNA polymerase primary sigma factor
MHAPRAPKVSLTEGVYVAATKASPSTDEPVKRTATKSHSKVGAKRVAAKPANGSATAKRATKTGARATKTTSGGPKTATAPRAGSTKKPDPAAKSMKSAAGRGHANKPAAPKDVEEVADAISVDTAD